MSSMHRRLASLALLVLVSLSAPAQCQDGSEWDRARAQMITAQPGDMADAIGRWRALTQASNAPFSEIAGFLLAYPGFPDEAKLRVAAEKSLALYPVDAARQIAFFDRFPPLTNPARAQYALALMAFSRGEAGDVARAAWRGGSMSDSAEAAILARYGAMFTTDDWDARTDALLWDGNVAQATRAIPRTSATARRPDLARLYLLQGIDLTTTSAPITASPAASAYPASPYPQAADRPGDTYTGDVAPPPYPSAYPSASPATPQPTMPLPTVTGTPMALDASLLGNAGYVYTRARRLLSSGQASAAASLLASRPAFAAPPLDSRKWIALQLAVARAAGPDGAARVAERIDDMFTTGTVISDQSFGVRDDYTSLMWLGGTTALWNLRDPRRAAPLFYRYANAARTPQTRAKGFYWAGRALAAVGQDSAATRYFQSAAEYPDQFYGMLSLERLGRPLPSLADPPHPLPSPSQRATFYARPLTRAVQYVARDSDWATTIRFFREIADQARTETDHVLVAELARAMGRRDLGVILGQAASNDRLQTFRDVSFPLMPVPAGTDWTMVHAITRQESQFSQNAVSRAGARGLMQLMPAYAAERARKDGMPYSLAALTTDPALNIRIGDAMFGRLMDSYGGSYPLAVAAYNAGAGNVNKWLRQNGDPRVNGNWVEWIEKIPFTETRAYVAHVLENAVDYEALYPGHARYRGADPLSHFLGKRTPG